MSLSEAGADVSTVFDPMGVSTAEVKRYCGLVERKSRVRRGIEVAPSLSSVVVVVAALFWACCSTCRTVNC